MTKIKWNHPREQQLKPTFENNREGQSAADEVDRKKLSERKPSGLEDL